jgi:hypothetical protein
MRPDPRKIEVAVAAAVVIAGKSRLLKLKFRSLTARFRFAASAGL